jgi:mRNA interferase RelE/StbE
MPYQIIVAQSAAKEIKQLPKPDIQAIWIKIKNLSNNPRPFGSKKLVGSSNKWRIRHGDYRIIYTIEDDILTVSILKVKHRKDVYE